MKVIKNIIFVAIVFLISIGLLVVGNGYDMYKDAISKIPLTEKVETIKEKENYTKIEEVPEIYIKAVISVEDHRFYKHNGIDIIAIGRATINDIKAREKKLGKRKVIFVITTDGMENASKEYTYATVSKMIDEQQKKNGWTFMFLGANIDASKEAERLKIPVKQSATYIQSTTGNDKMYRSLNENISNVQSGKEVDFSELEKNPE